MSLVVSQYRSRPAANHSTSALLVSNFLTAHDSRAFRRSSTFPRTARANTTTAVGTATITTTAAANTSASTTARVHKRSGTKQLFRVNTMAAMCSKEDARDSEASVNEPAKEVAAAPVTTSTPSTSTSEENQPPLKSTCPTCKGSGSIPPESSKQAPRPSGTVDIDSDVPDVENQLPPPPSTLPTPHPDFIHCMPPVSPTYRKFSVFTAGSIEMGKAVQWQKRMALELSHLPITVNNPRRGQWDPSATQEAKNEAFRHQVQWELSALEQADVICFFFDVKTLSPVTMVELGLWAGSGKVIVCCGKTYWRAGNVHLVCERYGIPMVESFAELPGAIEDMLKSKGMQLDAKGDLLEENVHVEKEKPRKKVELESEMEGLKERIRELEAAAAAAPKAGA